MERKIQPADKKSGVHEPLPPGITRQLQPDGTYTWHAIDPKTGARVQIDPEQAWFWTLEWQKREQAADDDLREGRYETFENFDDFLDSL